MVYAMVPAALDGARALQDYGFIEVKPWGIFFAACRRSTRAQKQFPEHDHLVQSDRQSAPRPRGHDTREDELVTHAGDLVFMPPEAVAVLDNNTLVFPQREVAQTPRIYLQLRRATQ
jgi:hypothetical protein